MDQDEVNEGGGGRPACYVGPVSEPPQAADASGLDAWLGDPRSRRPQRPSGGATGFGSTPTSSRATRPTRRISSRALLRVRTGKRTWKREGTEEQKLSSLESVIQSLHWDKIKSAASRRELPYADPQAKATADAETDSAPLALDVLITVEDEVAERAWLGRVQKLAEEKGTDPLMVELITLSQAAPTTSKSRWPRPAAPRKT